MMEKYRERKQLRRLKRIKKKADHAQKVTGKQHFVVKVNGLNGVKFMITNRELNKAYNKRAKKLGYPKVNINTLLNTAIYKTEQGTLTGK